MESLGDSLKETKPREATEEKKEGAEPMDVEPEIPHQSSPSLPLQTVSPIAVPVSVVKGDSDTEMQVDGDSNSTEKLEEDIEMKKGEVESPPPEATVDQQESTQEDHKTVPPTSTEKTEQTDNQVSEIKDEPQAEERKAPIVTEEKKDEQLEESKTPIAMEDNKEKDAAVHHPMKEGKCFADDHVTIGADKKKKVNIEPLKAEITRLREDGKSWTDILALVFGYRYTLDWSMKKVDSDEGFTFLDQKHYELLGDVILNYVQEVMRVKYNLVEVRIPDPNREPNCNIFHSRDFLQNQQRCLLLIQGAGAVRAGQWARSVCINAKLTEGTVFPALEFAEANGFSVIVFNPNYTHDPVTHQAIPIIDSMEKHSRYIWKNFIHRCPAQDLYIIAHSCGGMCTTDLLDTYEVEFVERVKAVAFTDSVHGGLSCGKRGKEHLGKIAVDFVASNLPLKTHVSSLRNSYNGCVHVSSGHSKHEYTTGYAMPGIVEFFNEMMEFGSNMFLDRRA